MTEPSEHARRAAEEIVVGPTLFYNHIGDSHKMAFVAQLIQQSIDAATAELEADKARLDLVLKVIFDHGTSGLIELEWTVLPDEDGSLSERSDVVFDRAAIDRALHPEQKEKGMTEPCNHKCSFALFCPECVTTLRAELEAAHKSDGLNIDRIRELSAELAQCRGELERLTPGYAEVCQQNVALEAERDTLKGENERLKGDVAEADRIAQNAAETEQQTANRASRIEQHCLGLSKALTSHRLLLDEMGKQLTAAKIALRSYQFGNGSTELAQEIADAIEPALTKYQQQCGEKVK